MNSTNSKLMRLFSFFTDLSLVFTTIIIVVTNAHSQEVDLAKGIFGNEWVDYSKPYVKVKVAEDKVYRLSYEDLLAAGVPQSKITGNALKIVHNGEEIPIYISQAGQFQSGDYVLFYGKKNKAELDKYLFEEPERDMLNDEYSIITDSSAYFLTWDNSNTSFYRDVNIDYNDLRPETRAYVHQVDFYYNSGSPYKPVLNSGNVRFSSFVPAEGYGTGLTNSFTQKIPVEDRINIGRNPRLRYRFGTNLNELNTTVSINGQELISYYNPGYRNRVISLDTLLDYALIGTELNVRIVSNETARTTVSRLSLEYTRTADWAKASTNRLVIPASNKEQYFKIKNYPESTPPIIFNESKGEKYNSVLDNGELIFFVPPSATDQIFAITTSDNAPAQILPQKTFVDFSKLNYQYLVLTSRLLNNEDNDGNAVEEYLAYRRSVSGGNYNAGAVNVEDLYDQFSFGLDRHFLAIRHFAHYIKSQWSDLEYVFIVGKGREYTNQRRANQLEDTLSAKMLVPTYGTPGSDNLMFRKVDGPSLVVNIGRVAVNDKTELRQYLQKVMAHEDAINNPQTIEDKLWQKKILHLSGGDTKIQESIRIQLDAMARTIEKSRMGADVTTIAKFSTSPITVAISDEVKRLFDTGLSLVTFFGHSSGVNLDFSLGDISSLGNDKYPVMIALGCNAGNIHGSSNLGVSEQYVLTPNTGMVGFLASSGNAYSFQQYEYGDLLYSELGNINYGLPISKSINAVLDSFAFDFSEGSRTFAEQVTFHGDPALRVYFGDGPDLTPDPASVYTRPESINTYDGSFEVCFHIANLGVNTGDSSQLRVLHTLPNGSEATDTVLRISMPPYSEEYCIMLPITDNGAAGIHNVQVTVDVDNEIAEIPGPAAENNNTLVINGKEGFDFFMANDAAKPIYPMEFGIIDVKRPTLLASTYNAFAPARDYLIQFDTSGVFDSPSLVSEKVRNVVALLEWEVPYDLTHERVYYWRISPDTTDGSMPIWEESSFLYHKDIPNGWNQSHYHQFLKNDFENLMYDEETRKLEFARNFRDLRIENRKRNTNVPHFYFQGGDRLIPFHPDILPGIGITLFDDAGNRIFSPYPDQEYGFYDFGMSFPHFGFKDIHKAETRQNIINFLDNFVEEGTRVVLNTAYGLNQSLEADKWAEDSLIYGIDLLSYLESQGAEKVRNLEMAGTAPYIFHYIKGKGKLDEEVGINADDEVVLVFQIAGRWDEGSLTTKNIGPSSNYQSVTWQKLSTNNISDTIKVSLIGVSPNGSTQILIDDLNEGTTTLENIDTEKYQSIRLYYNSKDKKNFNPSEISYWRTTFESSPDLSFIKADGYEIFKDTLQQGDSFRFTLPVKNYSNASFPATSTEIILRDKSNTETVSQIELSPIEAGGVAEITYSLPTANMDGDYNISVNANASRSPMENYYFNNFASFDFHVFKEEINPILDVTFDGIHILNEDIVSPTPEIVLWLKDENPFLLLNDTAMIQLELISPNGSRESIGFGDPRITFFPATEGSDNQAKIEFRPTLTEEGLYQMVVRASDVTGNTTGEKAYEVSFQVILKNQISEMYNYPNPFSTSTEFIFTLTGNEIPTDYTIQIMTISGKVVKEIKTAELGPIRIGLNRTRYKWDGTDEFGNRLGNGVYLYRLITNRADGSAFEKLEREQDSQFFKKGWGKMVILR